MNEGGDRRTAPATPGLLNVPVKVQHIQTATKYLSRSTLCPKETLK